MKTANEIFKELDLPREGFEKSKKGIFKKNIEYNSFFTMLNEEDPKIYLSKLFATFTRNVDFLIR